ncbi:MAG: heavy-metal-associated domain-containing protein [Anaerolineae bacterium]|nr:heavy-metal-associated domain-containing protein [Anaerolineae bacterium]
MRTVNWVVPDYHCHHCLSRITDALRDIKGVRLLRSDPTTHTLTIEGSGPEVLAFAKRHLAQAGYPVQSNHNFE